MIYEFTKKYLHFYFFEKKDNIVRDSKRSEESPTHRTKLTRLPNQAKSK